MNIGPVEVGGANPCRFVAEISGNHNGDRDRCGRLIDAAQAAGADLVKFQCYTPDELIALRGDGAAPEPWGSQGWTMRALYEKAQTPLDWFPKIAAHCERVGMPWFSSVFGSDSLAALEAVGCPAYKIARLDNRSAFARSLANIGKPLIVSEANEGESQIWDTTILWCPPGYPQTDFRAMRVSLEWRAFDGLSYHGTDPRIPFAAAMMGAKIIECHVQLDDEPSELEANVSLTMTQQARLIRDVRDMEALLGCP